ncbi:aminodeoxychorismate synthase component I, partial [Rhizobium johnstonii]
MPALDDVRAASAAGLHAAGFVSYEAGAAFEPILGSPAISRTPLVWFGLFDGFEEIAPDAVPTLLPDPAGGWMGAPRPGMHVDTYRSHFARVQ